MKILTDFHKVGDPHKMRCTSHYQTQLFHRRDVRFGERFALDLEFRDSCREDVSFEPRDDFLVDVSDGDEGVSATADNVQIEISPAKGIQVQSIHCLAVTCIQL